MCRLCGFFNYFLLFFRYYHQINFFFSKTKINFVQVNLVANIYWVLKMDRVGNKTKQEKYRIRGLTRLEGVNICVEFIFPPLDRVDLICKKNWITFFCFSLSPA